MSERLQKARRLVVKVGSALLVDMATGRLKESWLETLAQDMAGLHAGGADVLVVSSGSIALGARLLGLAPRAVRNRLEERQAAAAVGQIALAGAWAKALERHGITTGQVLLTLMDTEERRRYLNARATLQTLLKRRAIPVINENDTVATDEIRYGDNDRLAARVASMVRADCLVLLSDVDGLYTAPPDAPGARHIPRVEKITRDIVDMAGEAATDVGSGGMKTKVEAARIATKAGVDMVIASGKAEHPLRTILQGGRCTWFASSANPVAARKRWIAGALAPVGAIIVDDGAVAALKNNKSLLPVGVIGARGSFARGDAVRILDRAGRELGRGLSAYSSADVQRIKGLRSADLQKALGQAGRDVLIHRDDLVLTGQDEGD